MKFRFAEEEDACEYVTRVVGEMHQYAPPHILKVGCPVSVYGCRLPQDDDQVQTLMTVSL